MAKSVQVGDVCMHFDRRGSGFPMLMLHGGYLDHRHMMNEMEPAFFDRSGWQRLYLDLPAHGLTASLQRPMRFDAILGHVIGFMDQVLPGQKFAVAGMSAGGHLVRGLVSQIPERLLGAMINAAPFVVEREKRDLPGSTAIHEDAEFAKMAGKHAEELRELQPVRDVALADWCAECMAPAESLLDEPAAFESWEPHNYAFGFELEDPAAPFVRPALILAGRQDTVAGYQDSWASIEHFPRATFAALDGCGHFIAPAKRRLFLMLVSDWLDRIELDSRR